MTANVSTRPSLRFRGRSFMALVLAPEVPLRDWLEDLDAVSQRSPGFFLNRAIIVDVSVLKPSKSELKFLLAALKMRDIRIMALEGAAAAVRDPDMPFAVQGGRPAGDIEVPNLDSAIPVQIPALTPARTSRLVEGSIRSGQSVVHTEGDIVILGSVASGAEVVAGGSIHIYGALRGRAIAGCSGDSRARIYCSKLEAELLAIDGLYKTADDLGAQFHNQRVQVNLDNDSLIIRTLD